MKELSITARMLIVALAPAVLVATLLSLWLLLERMRDVERAEMSRALTLAEGLALASEYAVASGNQALLTDVSRPTLSIPAIIAIRFTDRQGEILQSSRASALPPHHAQGLDGHWWSRFVDPVQLRVIEQPVLRTDLSEFDEPLFTDTGTDGNGQGQGVAGKRAAAEQQIGTLHMTVDLSPAYHRQFDSMWRALPVSVLVLLLATPTAVWLARGVLHLSNELRSFHARLRESTRIATVDLHLALDALERRNRELDEAREAAEKASAFKSDFSPT